MTIFAISVAQIDGIICEKADFSQIAAGILLVRESGGRNLAIKQDDDRSENIKAIWDTMGFISGNQTISKKLFDLYKL